MPEDYLEVLRHEEKRKHRERMAKKAVAQRLKMVKEKDGRSYIEGSSNNRRFPHRRFGTTKKCTICHTSFFALSSEKGLFCSNYCFSIYWTGKKSKNSDEKHFMWKGDKVGYKALHDWVGRKLGKPKICSSCNTTESKQFEWANISREYKRDINDWKRLCCKCHKAFDNIPDKNAVKLLC